MKKVVLSVVAALAFSAAPAFAADMPVKAKMVGPAPGAVSPWDIAFGAAVMNDYVFRGSRSRTTSLQSRPISSRATTSQDMQLYAGISGESIKFPNGATAEIDFYGGVRPTFGPLALDFGVWYYDYPGGTCFNTEPHASARSANSLPNGNVVKAS